MSDNIAIIFGAGSKIGLSVTNKFLSNDYKVVTVSRSDFKIDNEDQYSENYYHFKADLTDLSVVPKVFAKTKELFGEPRVIIYNAAAVRWNEGKDDVFDPPVEELIEHTNVNTFAVYSALQQAIKIYPNIKSSKPKTFIFTGNAQNLLTFPTLFTLGVGKSATYSALQVADNVYGSKYGYRFYFADERVEDGGPAIQGTSGPAAAEFYYDLAENENKGIPVEATFVPGKGYVKF
ncbi:hypothetical protein WICMUC_004997 [Wickerhamomyces mucosus]|uniref:Uncharacterized protein n=1 Tax=Wickerhamomyces mucosus TaxID=1378264 RepID=A0A9P8PBD7_9ASCO|nr:hypothetical protein WICMUC_004997 [Wickerhamomyces mucosus]